MKISKDVLGAILLLVLGITFFLSGFHNIDLAQNLFRTVTTLGGNPSNWYDRPLLPFYTVGFEQMYLMGMGMMFVGTVLIGVSCYWLGINNKKVDRK